MLRGQLLVAGESHGHTQSGHHSDMKDGDCYHFSLQVISVTLCVLRLRLLTC